MAVDRSHFGTMGGVRLALIVTQILTAIAFLITLGGLASLQHKANNLPLAALSRLSPTQGALLTQQYIETFQSGNQIPYPNHGRWQFGFQWYALWLEVALFTWILVMAIFPRTILRMKHVAMCLLAYAFVLTTFNVNSLLYFHRTAAANATFSKRAITATLAGTMMGAICNGLTIIFLGLIGTGSDATGRLDVSKSQGGMLRRNKVADLETGGTTPPTSMDTANVVTGHAASTGAAPMHNVDVLKTSPP